MKSLIALTAIAAFTIGTAIAGKPSAFSTSQPTVGTSEPIVMMAEQELPFDRYWSKN
jgi:hypothetical protein